MAGQVQVVYIDPPYGVKYGSNFQPLVNKREVKDGKDEDLTQEPETIRAFRDTWELGIHSYLVTARAQLSVLVHCVNGASPLSIPSPASSGQAVRSFNRVMDFR